MLLSSAARLMRLSRGSVAVLRGMCSSVVEQPPVEASDINHKIPPPPNFRNNALIKDEAEYRKLWERSVKDPEGFWGEIAKDFQWMQPWKRVFASDFNALPVKWFENAKLNISVNCLDRHIKEKGNKPAITYEADNGQSQTLTYKELLDKVCQMGNLLRSLGVKKGDTVSIFMPMIPELVVSLLACARIGAVHSVVFSGFSAQGLATRLVDAKSRILITSDIAIRGGKLQHVKDTADEAAELASQEGLTLEKMIVATGFAHDRTNVQVSYKPQRDVKMTEAMQNHSTVCPPEAMDAEDPLFILYTSGSTGKPKGVVHTTAGYMVYAATTFKYLFDLKPESDVHFCSADVGWVTGHTYIVYGPLANGAHSLMFEGIPTHPHPGRFWEIIEKHRVTIFYTAPTALRSLMVFGPEHVQKFDRSSLRLLGSVGEPINYSAWHWFNLYVGEERCPIIDTWWQTETGGAMLSPFPGCIPAKAGSAAVPFFGIKPSILDPDGKPVPQGETGRLCIDQAWPSVMRTLYGDPDRYVKNYFSDYKGKYFTGDGAFQDKDGYYWIVGRLDDVMNISGHRISTVEIESALAKHPQVAEVAAVSVPHAVKGESLYCYVILKDGVHESEALRSELKQTLRKEIGPIATPDYLHFTEALPKTRSGKIMRRILRRIANNDFSDLGDTSTLSNAPILDTLIRNRQNK